jgi:phage anti-repressor protein
MNKLIKPKAINFSELVKNSNTTLSLNLETKMVSILNTEFTENEQQWYIANLYIYMHYHPTNDYPINLENVFSMIGFANKGNAKRTLENNFTKDEDYKEVFIPREKNSKGGRPEEDIMLNIDTFKSLCMLAKTDKGKAIRKYYVKLENIYNKLIKEEIEEKDKQLLIKDVQMKKEVENTLRNSFDKRSLVYLIKINLVNEIVYKFGHTEDIVTRLRTHKNQIGEEIELIYCIETKDNKMLEKLLIDYLEQYKFRIKRVINNKTQTELIQVNDIEIIKNKLIELNKTVEDDKLLILNLKSKIIELENEIITYRQELLKNENDTINQLNNKIQELEKIISDNKINTNISKIPFISETKVIVDRIYKKQQVDKIDPKTLQIIETYECINSIIIKNPDYSYNGIYRAIKKNNVYKDFRWNYTGEKINSTNKIVNEQKNIQRVIQLDENKNFVKVYSTKTELCKILHIGLVRLNKYIEEGKILNDFYYINETSYKEELPENTNYNIHNSKSIRETNTETNEIVIYNSMKELYEKRGISRCTVRNCIKENRVCDKYKWEYVNNEQNKNNSKSIKEINCENNTFTIYDSMKKVYTKLNISLKKLRTIIQNNTIVNNCKYEFV